MRIKKQKNIVHLLLIPIMVSVFFVCPLAAQVGFQAGLRSYPFFISGYDEISDTYSAALSPKTYPVLSPKMKRVPRATSASFTTNSISFATDYYQLGSYRQSLVPVSVDADQYMRYRIDKSERSKFSELATNAITNPDKQTRTRGLGISVALPKRLDKIFGEGGAGLQVTGYRRITFSGRSQWNDQANTDTFRQSKFPSLNMEQISKFEITGTIGSKITVRVAQDSQTDIPLENRIQIRYKGDDDDILQAIEAGNTNLNLPNTQFVGYSQRIQGLFGLKAVAQVGNLTVTGIMSQEKGSAESASFTASGESAEQIRDYEYVRNRVFDLFYRDELPEAYDVSAGDSIKVLYLYEQIRDTETDEIAQGHPARYYVFPDEDRRGEHAGESEQVTVRQIEADQYEYEDDPVTGLPRLVFKSSRSPSRSIAFYMEIGKGAFTDSVVKVGDIAQAESDTLYLKVLSPNSGSADPSKKSWDLMWRNCYTMPRGVSGKDLDLKIFKGLSGTEQSTTQDNLEYQDGEGGNENFIQILGLDQTSTTNTVGADGRLDDHRSEVFRSDWGLLIFPHRQPFDNDSTFGGASALGVRVPQIYNNRQQTAIASASQYYIQISSRTRSSIIRLNRANIIEGSERVMLNGRQLSRGIDYNIMYDFGQITLLSQDALDPNAELSIDFEYAPFLSLQKKTLLGTRLQYDWSENIKFGTTFLYKSDKAEDRKPRVGQETATMLVMDFDASVRLKPSFLTDAANALPLVTTDVPSNLMITGEVAQSRPNPNVDDVAYVDDFESALNQLSLGTLRSNWNLASPPLLSIDTNVYYRGSLLWHNPDLSGEIRKVEDVYDREARQGEGILRTFRMIFTPVRGISTTTVFDSLGQDSLVVDTSYLPSYGGITRYFHSRVDGEKVRLFEFRARVNEGASATLHFDFGQISEDLHYDNQTLANANKRESPFSEDGYATNQPNGVVDNSEDVGLDGIPNNLEEGYDKDTLPDPSRDNWYFEGEGLCPLPDSLCAQINKNPDHEIWRDPRTRYLWLNGTEGNLRDNAVPDQERLSDNGFKEINAYYSFEVPLSGNNFVVEESELNGWKTYRIPVRDSALFEILSEDDIEASWSQVTHIRVWFSDSAATTTDTVEIADWYFVQSNWEDTIILDPLSAQFPENGSKLTVASVSTEDNTFTPPPGVEAYKDPTYNVEEPQRGLLLDFESLQFQDTAMATKELITVDQYSGYRKMRMYVSVEELNNADSVLFFMRIGRDQKNYYEHRVQVHSTASWDESQFVEIDFNDLTALKDSALRAGSELRNIDITEGKY
ncbi:MAG: cell surface protein SprA, partial [bacterium]|nr:cell surface protein SprA [bacterium]